MYTDGTTLNVPAMYVVIHAVLSLYASDGGRAW